MSYSEILKSQNSPRAEDVRLLLAHFPQSNRISRLDLVEAVEKSARIRLCGIRPHPKGAVLAIRSEDDAKKIKEAKPHCKKIPIFFTPFPEIQLPLAQRGKRWRIWGIPFTTTEEELQKALTTTGCTVTAVKMEYLQGRPDIRTENATFWVKEEEAVPKLTSFAGERVVVYPADPKPKSPKASAAQTTPPSNAQQAPEPTAAPANEKDVPSPTTSATPVSAKPQQAAPAPAASAQTPPKSSPTPTVASVAHLPLPQSPSTSPSRSPSLVARLDEMGKVTADLLQQLYSMPGAPAQKTPPKPSHNGHPLTPPAPDRGRPSSTSPGSLRAETEGRTPKRHNNRNNSSG